MAVAAVQKRPFCSRTARAAPAAVGAATSTAAPTMVRLLATASNYAAGGRFHNLDTRWPTHRKNPSPLQLWDKLETSSSTLTPLPAGLGAPRG